MGETWRLAVQIAAAAALLALLWSLFRFAMGLRSSKVLREEQRRREESRGRRIVAELPGAGGELVLFLEDADGFYWGAGEARKSALAGGRLLLNGAVVAACEGRAPLPPPPPLEAGEGRERWDVMLYLRDGTTRAVACGAIREGVSREAAARVFEAVRDALAAGAPAAGRE